MISSERVHFVYVGVEVWKFFLFNLRNVDEFLIISVVS